MVGDLCDDANLPLDEDVRPRILAGKSLSARQYLDALAEMERIQFQFAAALDLFDALATPTVSSGVFTPPPFTRLWLVSPTARQEDNTKVGKKGRLSV